jgi:hypothetical protein
MYEFAMGREGDIRKRCGRIEPGVSGIISGGDIVNVYQIFYADHEKMPVQGTYVGGYTNLSAGPANKTGLFFKLTAPGLFWTFLKLKETTRQCPRAPGRFNTPFHKEDLPLFIPDKTRYYRKRVPVIDPTTFPADRSVPTINALFNKLGGANRAIFELLHIK